MLDVRDGLTKKLANMIVVEVVDHPSALPVTHDQTQVAKQPKLMGNRRRLHPDRRCQLVDRARPGVQTPEDAQPARRRERLHRLSHDARRGNGQLVRCVI